MFWKPFFIQNVSPGSSPNDFSYFLFTFFPLLVHFFFFLNRRFLLRPVFLQFVRSFSLRHLPLALSIATPCNNGDRLGVLSTLPPASTCIPWRDLNIVLTSRGISSGIARIRSSDARKDNIAVSHFCFDDSLHFKRFREHLCAHINERYRVKEIA